ncbi:MAG: hypothetical protein ACKOOF_03830, partial [Planctomycetaceae bacterium]
MHPVARHLALAHPRREVFEVGDEAARQWEEWQATGPEMGKMPKQTRGWDDPAGITRPQRQKEESSDYRYFPEPDLVPV